MTNTALTGATFDIDGGQQLLGADRQTSTSHSERSDPCAPTSFPAPPSPTTSCPTTRMSPQAQRAAGRRPPDPHARARPLLPEGAPAASRARRVLPEDRGGLHAGRHDRDRRAPHAAGVPRFGRRPVAVPLRPRPHRPAGPGHPGVHRPRARPDDPAHARAQARARRPQHLQRLLVLGPPVGRRPLARPAGRQSRDPPRLGPQHPRAAGGLGRRRLLALPRLGPACGGEGDRR